MTEKQKLFAEEYLKDLNGSRAYKAAYPNVKKDGAARSRASELLKRKEIKTYIDQKLEEMHNENTATAEEILEYLTSVVRGKSKSSVLALCGEGQQRTIIKAPDEKEKLKAAELIGKRYGMFNDSLNFQTVIPVFAGEQDLKE
ncbi:terminase small subunit [Eggerthia catenaformis]|nr:terminase small subunit [Eggerthia catenaformis]